MKAIGKARIPVPIQPLRKFSNVAQGLNKNYYGYDIFSNPVLFEGRSGWLSFNELSCSLSLLGSANKGLNSLGELGFSTSSVAIRFQTSNCFIIHHISWVVNLEVANRVNIGRVNNQFFKRMQVVL